MTPRASAARRLGTAGYDLLVVAALWMAVYYPMIATGLFSGAASDSFDPRHGLLRATLAFLYFGWCWTHGGRTLGALAWKLELVRNDGARVGWRDAALRFGAALGYLVPLALLELATRGAPAPWAYGVALLAPFLLGTLAVHWDAQGRALHERPLATRIVMRSVA